MKRNEVSRTLFYTHQKQQSFASDVQFDCEYCTLKQKYSGTNQKCLTHSISQSNDSPTSVNLYPSNTIIDDILDLLFDAENLIEDYWSHLHQYSHGNVQKVRAELQPVFQCVNRIEQKLGRFPLVAEKWKRDRSEKGRSKEHEEERKMTTKSQKFITSNFSQLFEDSTVNDQIKQWVIYFQKILINREIKQEYLSLEDQLDMRIFKESMEKKFLTFARNYERYEAKVAQAFEKLLFYMETFGGALKDDVLNEDLRFIQESQTQQIKKRDFVEQKQWILMQALTIEQLLAQKELYYE